MAANTSVLALRMSGSNILCYDLINGRTNLIRADGLSCGHAFLIEGTIERGKEKALEYRFWRISQRLFRYQHQLSPPSLRESGYISLGD